MGIRGDAQGALGDPVSVSGESIRDFFMPIDFPRYIARRFVLTDASEDLSFSLAAIALFTGPGGTGTTICSANAVTELTGPDIAVTIPIVAATAVLTATLNPANGLYGCYLRVTTAGAATLRAYLIGDTP